MRLAVSLLLSRVPDCSTMSRNRNFHKCCLNRHFIKPDDVQKPAAKFIVFQRDSHKDCRTARAKYFADAIFLQVIDLEDADFLDDFREYGVTGRPRH